MSEHTSTIESAHGAHGHEEHHHGPKNPVRLYIIVLSCLLFLTFITVLVAQFDFGDANIFAALLIATVKATLVALFFMHLLHDKPMNSIIIGTAFLLLSLFLAFDFMDSGTRVTYIPGDAKAPAGSEFNLPPNLLKARREEEKYAHHPVTEPPAATTATPAQGAPPPAAQPAAEQPKPAQH